MVALTPGKFEGAGGWAEHSSQVQCALCYSAPLDFAALGQGLKGSLDLFLGDARGHVNPREQASPINYVSEASPPFFICHGAQDDLVPVDQSERFVAALRNVGAPVEFIRVADAGHDLERHSENIFAAALAFLDKYLKKAAT
jgi:acetyl esterase/lipase